MAWAQFIQQGIGMIGSIYDQAAEVEDAKTSRTQGYASANENEERLRRDSAYRLGGQQAELAQSGFDSSSGSMLMLQGDSAANAELDALTARYKGELNAWEQGEKLQRAKEKMEFMRHPTKGLWEKVPGGKYSLAGRGGSAAVGGMQSMIDNPGRKY